MASKKDRHFSIDDNRYFNFVKDDWKCPICGRGSDDTMDEHHLIPKSKKGKETVTIHRVCHDKIHSVFTNQELAKDYYTVDLIMQNEAMQKFAGWVAKKGPNFIDPSIMSNKRNPRKRK